MNKILEYLNNNADNLTEEGKALSDKYNADYLDEWVRNLQLSFSKKEEEVLDVIQECLGTAEAIKTRFLFDINDILYRKKLKSQDLAKSLGVGKSYMSKILNDKTHLSFENMVKIAEILGLRIVFEVEEKDARSKGNR